ncbi:glycosyltransferase [Lentzea sp. NPDC004782]|uniref:glycosyltransferase family 2 protein n=1 Tax=Lentzea sp. NPDC004782 TaxID=3154458 RepID=UPI0033ABF4F0
MSPLVSVVIPTKNRPEPLAEALRSVAAQTVDEVEVVVVNDGGVDVSHVIAEFAGELSTQLVNRDSSQGVGDARNAALDVARGKYVSFLDDDDLYLPGHLARALKVLEQGDVDFVHANAGVRTDRGAPVEQTARNYDLPSDVEFLHVLNFVPPLSVVCRNPRDLPGARFDVDLPLCEDWEMWLRLIRVHGYRCANVPEVTAIYHRLENSSSMTADADYNLDGFQSFFDCWKRICARYPVAADSRAARYRQFGVLMHEIIIERLIANVQLPHLYYEDILHILFDGFTGKYPDDEVRARMETLLDSARQSDAMTS